MKYLALLFMLIFPMFLIGQKIDKSKIDTQDKLRFAYFHDKSISAENFFVSEQSFLGLTQNDEMIMEHQLTGENGYDHLKYQQYHKGLEVYGAEYIVHSSNGIVISVSGRIEPFLSLDVTPFISADHAEYLALQSLNFTSEVLISKEPTLCIIDPAYPSCSENFRISYQIDLKSHVKAYNMKIFVDAKNGMILNKFPLTMNHSVSSSVQTKYYGNQTITTDSIGPNDYVLRDLSRGDGIVVFGRELYSNASINWDWESMDDQIALDAHFCMQEYFDMMLEDYNWMGLDGQGGQLRAFIRYTNGQGGYFDGSQAFFSDGDCNQAASTTLDIIGHEFAHGYTQYSSGLVYLGESGAINESISDIIGKLLENRVVPSEFTWNVGQTGLEEAIPFRKMDDPNSIENPSYYQGLYWSEEGAVHTNSAVANLWFSMLVDGKIGTNEEGLAYEVPAIGFENAGNLIFLTTSSYLVGGSDYNDLCLTTIAAAEELFGVGSPEVFSVQEAWMAVGLPHSMDGEMIYDLSVADLQGSKYLCASSDEFQEVNVTIANLGNMTYFPTMEGSVTLSSVSLAEDYILALVDTLYPGDRQTYLVNDWLVINPGDLFLLEKQLDYSLDLNIQNNYSASQYEVGGPFSNDLSLFSWLKEETCHDNFQEITAFVRNRGCELISAGTTWNLVLENDDGIIWEHEFELENDLLPLMESVTTFSVDLEGIENGSMQLILNFDDDPIGFNNIGYLNLSKRTTVTEPILYDFSNAPLEDQTLRVDANFNPHFNWDDEFYFGTTGGLNNYDFFSNCQNLDNMFPSDNLGGGITCNLSFCLDLSGYIDPMINFDLTQFRNDMEEGQSDNSTALQVSWNGSDSFEEIFVNQPEGIVSNHSLPMPQDFVGEVKFRFYNEIGSSSGLIPELLDQNDFSLIDNLEITASPVGILDLDYNNSFSIAPNPFSDLATFSSDKIIKVVNVYSIQGKLLESLALDSKSGVLDLSRMSTGIYFVHVFYNDKEKEVKRIVKF